MNYTRLPWELVCETILTITRSSIIVEGVTWITATHEATICVDALYLAVVNDAALIYVFARAIIKEIITIRTATTEGTFCV